MSYKHVWEDKGLYRKYSGRVSGKEITQAVEEVHGHALFDSIRYVINNCLDVTQTDITSSEVTVLAALDKAAARSNPNIKIAIVATDSTIQKLAELYGDLIKHSPYTSKIFTNLDEARAWAT